MELGLLDGLMDSLNVADKPRKKPPPGIDGSTRENVKSDLEKSLDDDLVLGNCSLFWPRLKSSLQSFFNALVILM